MLLGGQGAGFQEDQMQPSPPHRKATPLLPTLVRVPEGPPSCSLPTTIALIHQVQAQSDRAPVSGCVEDAFPGSGC